MSAIFQKDLKRLLYSPTGYVVAALFLLCAGVTVTFFQLFMANADLGLTLTSLQLPLLLLIPFLTVKTVTEERVRRTELLIFSLPIRTRDAVLGNYFAVTGFVLLFTAPLGLYPLLLSAMGEIDLAAAYTALLGFVLLEAALVALCAFLCTVAPNKPVALLLSIGVPLVLLLLSGLLPSVGGVNLFFRFSAFVSGRLDLGGVLFDLSFTALLLFLRVHAIKLRRTASPRAESRPKRLSRRTVLLGVSAVALAVTILFNAALALLPYNLKKLPLSDKSAYRISGQTVDALRKLPAEEVTLSMICEGGLAIAENSDLYAFLVNYTAASDSVTLRVVDPKRDPDWIAPYSEEWPADGSILVESARRHLLIHNQDLFFYYSSALGAMSIPEWEMVVAYLVQTQNSTLLQQLTQDLSRYFNAESRLTNALQYVTSPTLPTVYWYVGAKTWEADSALSDRLRDTCYELRTVAQLSRLPDDCDLLVLHAPEEDLTKTEAEALSAYLADGGKLLLTTASDYVALQSGKTVAKPNLLGVLAEYGMGVLPSSHTVKDRNPNYTVANAEGMLFHTKIATHDMTPTDTKADFVAAYPHAITLTPTDGVTLTPWLTTSSAAYLSVTEDDGKTWKDSEEKQSFAVGAIAEKGESAIVWISSPMSLTASVNGDYAADANFALFDAVCAYLTDGGQEMIRLAASPLPMPAVRASVTELFIFGAVLVLLVPLAAVTVGATTGYVRKKR